jgi:glycosyltransferase involved in cell wall biosynthesis
MLNFNEKNPHYSRYTPEFYKSIVMKILYYSPHPMLSTAHHAAGYATHINEMIEAFRTLGHEVLLVIMGDNSGVGSEVGGQESAVKSVMKRLIPKLLWESLKDVKLKRFDKYAEKILAQNVAEFKPDVIYERANYMQVSGVKTAKKFGIRHILEVNSPYPEERIVLQGRTLLMKQAERAEKIQCETTDRIVVVSSALRDHFIRKYALPKTKFLITPNAINLENVTLNPVREKELNEQFKPNGELIVGFVGSFFRWHGIDMLIEAFGTISESYPKAKLIIIGTGEIEQELKDLAKKYSQDKIIFTGRVDRSEIFDYINLFDIAVMANSNWYGSPVKIFEYGVLKKAIIAPDYAPLRDVMTNETDGILIQPTVENLTLAISRLLNDSELRTKIGNNFYKKVNSNHLWSKNAEEILS